MTIALLTSNANKTYQTAGDLALKSKNEDIAVFSYKLHYVANDVFIGVNSKVVVYAEDFYGNFYPRARGVAEGLTVSSDGKINIAFRVCKEEDDYLNELPVLNSLDGKFVKNI